jgi:hypothetical protein
MRGNVLKQNPVNETIGFCNVTSDRPHFGPALKGESYAAVAQKDFGIAAVNGGIVEVLTMFVLGVLVCTVIYSACDLCEGALSPRKDTMEPFGHQHRGSSVKRLRPSRC